MDEPGHGNSTSSAEERSYVFSRNLYSTSVERIPDGPAMEEKRKRNPRRKKNIGEEA